MKRNGANLTEGKPVKLILQFAIPVFLGNLFQLFYGVFVTKIVGSTLGEGALAAGGSVSILYNLLTVFFNGLTLGFSVVTARYFGAGDTEKLKKSVAGTILLGFVTAAILVTGVFVFLRPLLSIMHVPAEQKEMAYTYISFLVLGMFVTLAYNMCANVLRAIGDSMTPLIFLILAAVLNVILDYVCILVFSMGVGGAAAATVISQVVSVVLCVIHIKRHFPILQVERRHFKLEKSEVRTMLSGGLSMGMMSSLVNLGTLALQTSINRLGRDIIVAHTAARKITEMFMIMFGVFGQTMAIFCGQNAGAGRMDRVRHGIGLAVLYTCIWSVMTVIFSFTIGKQLIYLVTGSRNETVILNATNYLKFDTVFYFVTAVISVLRNAMQGLGETVIPLVSSALEMIGKVVIAVTLVPLLGYTGVIVAEPIVWIIMVIPLIVKIFKMPELKKTV